MLATNRLITNGTIAASVGGRTARRFRDPAGLPPFGAGFRKRPRTSRAYVHVVGDRDFDFWVGRWEVRWGDGAAGTNV
ncbi:MAG: hypothetical protein ACRD2A_21950, partial [Vicinamibacterales bacterium]